MNGPAFAVSDGANVGISAIPVRDYFLRFRIAPRSIIKERETSLLEISGTSLQIGTSRIPAIGFMKNSTRIIVSFYTDERTGLQFAATETLPLNVWTEVSVYLSGNKLTLVCLNSKRPFANRITLGFSRNVVNSAFIYAGSNSIPAASALIQNIKVCSNNELDVPRPPTAAPTMLRTRAPTVEPTVEPTVAPTLQPTVQPTLLPTVEPTPTPTASPTADATVVLTEITTIYVPAPTSTPTSSPTLGIPGIPESPIEPGPPEVDDPAAGVEEPSTFATERQRQRQYKRAELSLKQPSEGQLSERQPLQQQARVGSQSHPFQQHGQPFQQQARVGSQRQPSQQQGQPFQQQARVGSQRQPFQQQGQRYYGNEYPFFWQ